MKKLDFTTYACAERCEQEFVYRHVRHLIASGVEAAPHFGHVVHVGVRALYDGHSVADAWARMRADWTQGVEATLVANALREETQVCDLCGGVGAFGAAPLPPASGRKGPWPQRVLCTCSAPSWSALLDPKKPHLSLWRAREIVRTYAEEYGLNEDALHFGEEVKPQAFDVVWNEGYAESATEASLPDRCVRSKADGLLYAMDLKTSSLYTSPAWQRSFEHNQQVAIQLDTLEATLGERVSGFWLDAIHIGRSGAPKPEDFSRYGPLTYSEALRAELRAQRVVQAQRIAQLRAQPTDALKSPSACVRFGSLCQFFQLCQADPADREALVQIALGKGTLKEEAWEPKSRQ